MTSDTVASDPEASAGAGSAGNSRQYVNHLSVTLSLSEVLLDFGQLFASSPSVKPLSCLVTSPVHLRRFGEQLAGTIVRYEARYGPLPSTEADGES